MSDHLSTGSSACRSDSSEVSSEVATSTPSEVATGSGDAFAAAATISDLDDAFETNAFDTGLPGTTWQTVGRGSGVLALDTAAFDAGLPAMAISGRCLIVTYEIPHG